MKKRIVVFFGTRPEALKLAPVVRALRAEPSFSVRTILTGQHREMIDPVLKLFQLKVDADLRLMTPNQTLSSFSKRLLGSLDGVFNQFKPELAVVQGDTTTAFIVGLCAFYHRTSLAHVEAGLRSQRKFEPFPEEINRRLITHLADFHFSPTREAKQNLLKEGVAPERILVTGNTVVDSLYWVRDRLKKNYPQLKGIDFSKRIVLMTAHRRESIGRGLVEICRAVKEIVRRFPDLIMVYPAHLNPGVRAIVKRELKRHPRIHILKPLPYDQTVFLMQKSYLIMTDSGGIQEEATALGKPVLVLRNVSERMEGVRAGALQMVGTHSKKIVREASRLLTSHQDYARMARVRHLYGDGRASKRIVRALRELLGR